MSTINAQNYGDGTDSVPASAVIEGTAKAWASIGGGVPEIDEEYNFSSFTDQGAGDFLLSFTNDMNTVTYAVGVNPAGSNINVSSNSGVRAAKSNKLTGSFTVDVTENGNSSDEDADVICFGDLA